MEYVPRIEMLTPKKLVGFRLTMSLMNNKTRELWQRFMPRRKEITTAIDKRLYSLQVYDARYTFSPINPAAEFEKWALIEVPDFNHVPEGMETRELGGGLYAVFHYKGRPSEGFKVFRYIFETWLPSSGYRLDSREHFELLDERYKGEDQDSEEEIWVPVINAGY